MIYPEIQDKQTPAKQNIYMLFHEIMPGLSIELRYTSAVAGVSQCNSISPDSLTGNITGKGVVSKYSKVIDVKI